ncbi:MAG TPA: hypothetical protein VKU60_05200 [Chloroflexota bacterium]|nr:hypothetical protein [Chloroflexota bacterium]
MLGDAPYDLDVILRCTSKLRSLLLDSNARRSVAAVAPDRNDWYANLL